MKLVLHPGHSKCGSTTIQKAIIKNRKLLESHGYVIPDPQMRTPGDEGFNPNGETPRAFFRHAMEQKDLEPLKAKLARIKEKYGDSSQSVLISAENLVNQLGAASGLNIHRLLRDTFVSHEVIYYIRRQDQFIMSAWQQWGYKKGLSLQAFVEQALRGKNPNYRVIASAFSNLYGKSNVTVVPLLRDSLIEGDLVADFFARLGIISEVQKPEDSIDNKSLNPYLCEALSKVNHIFRDIHDESIKHQLEKSHSSDPALYMRDDDYMSAEVRRRIHDVFASDNRFIANNHETGVAWYEFSKPIPIRGETVISAEKGAQRILEDLGGFSSLGAGAAGKIKKNIEVYPERSRTLPTRFPTDHMLISKNLQEIEPAVRVLHLANADVCLKPAKAFLLNGSSVKALSTPAGERHLQNRNAKLQKVSGRILDLTTPGSNLYSHWLLDLLPKIKAVTEAGYDIGCDFDRIIVNFYGSRFKRESFKLLGIDDSIVSDYTNHLKCFTAEDIVSVTPCRRALYTPQWVSDFVRSLFYTPQALNFSSKIYISRSKGNARRILNEAQLIEHIKELGYKTYYCEDHSISETAAIMRNATHVIAPHGAGLANIVFSEPGTQVTELFCAHLSAEFYKLSTANGLIYRPVQALSNDNELVDVVNMDYANDRDFYHRMNMTLSDEIIESM
ncbi:glycosyltransferase family 61 protein [Cobetia sp. D5]|uniref:glycosyltransferase family 61 protein n=1 Tax=Cobetia sp. D5 TaxID=3105867 RepID=UPI002D76B188|nr:glycosyltransferase family 61 protein [Cobetia sp. D5]